MSRRSTRTATGLAESGVLPAVQSHIVPSNPSASAPSAGLYFQSHYNHPANNRLFLGPNLSQPGYKGHHGAIGSAVPKAPKPPEKPLMPYMRYSRKVWDEVKANNPDAKLWEIGKIIGQMWRELPTADKQQFIEEYEVEKVEHLDLMKSYHNSPSYQSYLHAKSRAEALEASADSLGAEKDDAYMSIEPIDDNAEDDAEFSVKHVAAARFQRNHRLINDILGESIHVPNTRAVVTTHRLSVLKNQVQSLKSHQKKLVAELNHIEETHEAKKRKWKDQAKAFQEDMKRLCSMSPQEYYKEYKQKQQLLLQQQKQQQALAEAAKQAAEAQATTEDDTSQNTEDKSEKEKPASVEESQSQVDAADEKPVESDSKEEDVPEKMDVEEAAASESVEEDQKADDTEKSTAPEVQDEEKDEEKPDPEENDKCKEDEEKSANEETNETAATEDASSSVSSKKEDDSET